MKFLIAPTAHSILRVRGGSSNRIDLLSRGVEYSPRTRR